MSWFWTCFHVYTRKIIDAHNEYSEEQPASQQQHMVLDLSTIFPSYSSTGMIAAACTLTFDWDFCLLLSFFLSSFCLNSFRHHDYNCCYCYSWFLCVKLHPKNQNYNLRNPRKCIFLCAFSKNINEITFEYLQNWKCFKLFKSLSHLRAAYTRKIDI